MTRAPGPSRSALAVLVAALLAGCWDAPVRERLEVELLADGTARAILVVEIDPPSRYEKESEEPLRRRLERKARDLEEGSDPWLARFDVEGCPRQGGSWQRDDGALVEFRRSMHCETPEQAFLVLGAAPVAVDLGGDGELAELSLVPLGGGEAGRRDRQDARAAIARWAERLESYHAAGWALAERAGERPDLAEALWAAGLDVSEAEGRVELPAAEERLAQELREATEAAFQVLRPQPGEAETADELVRRVYDPLPARLWVKLPVRATSVEGFEAGAGASYAAPEQSLYAAFERLADRWLAPDPLTARVRHGRSGAEGEVAVGPFVAVDPRRGEEPPTAPELEEALVAELERRDPLRLVWPAAREEQGEGDDDAGID